MNPKVRLYEFGPFTINPSERTLLRDGSPVFLRPKVFNTLLILVLNSGRLVSNEELIKTIWPNTFVAASNLTIIIYELRRALGDEAHIETVRGHGYRLAIDVKEIIIDDTNSIKAPLNLILKDTRPMDSKSGLLRQLLKWLGISEDAKVNNATRGSAQQEIQLPRNISKHVKDPRRLRVFLCHSSKDKPIVRNLYSRLRNDGIDPWLDEENLLPGQDWQQVIPKAVRTNDVVVICLSNEAITKSGYVQKEIKYALDVADEQPEGTIFLIPLKLERCDMPERLSRWQWVNLFEDNGYERLMLALKIRAKELGLDLVPIK
jgi:DNA-binding winged helix-turn-helix (wHTH) protein